MALCYNYLRATYILLLNISHLPSICTWQVYTNRWSSHLANHIIRIHTVWHKILMGENIDEFDKFPTIRQ